MTVHFILSTPKFCVPPPNEHMQQSISTTSSSAQSNPRPKKSSTNQQSAESSVKKASATSSSNSRFVRIHFLVFWREMLDLLLWYISLLSIILCSILCQNTLSFIWQDLEACSGHYLTATFSARLFCNQNFDISALGIGVQTDPQISWV